MKARPAKDHSRACVIFREGSLSVETVTFGQFSESEHWGTREPARPPSLPWGKLSHHGPHPYACSFAFQGQQFPVFWLSPILLFLAPVCRDRPRIPGQRLL